MFCQNCGAELRPDTGFCGVCGAGAPAPRLHIDPKQENKQSQPRSGASQTPPATGSRAPQASLTKSQPAYQSPLPRNVSRHVAPVASLEVPKSKASPSELLNPATPPPAPPTPGEAVVLPDAPASVQAAPAAATVPVEAASGVAAPARPSASILPPVSPLTQQTLMGYYPAGWVPIASTNGAAAQSQPEGYTVRLVRSTTGLTLPRDTPNRVAAAALAGLLISFFLPWVIISGIRASALSVGWPIALPILLVASVGLTILLPERALYARFFLALPLMVGCFFLGCALLIFLLSSAIAANAVGPNFLGVDVGFVLFAAASLALAWAGYYKLVRELPLVTTGRLPLAPLPRFLRVLAEKPAAPVAAAAQAVPVVPLQSAAPVTQSSHAAPPTISEQTNTQA